MKFLLTIGILLSTIGRGATSCTGSCLEDLKALRIMDIQRQLSASMKSAHLGSNDGSVDFPQAMLKEAQLSDNHSPSKERPSFASFIPAVLDAEESPLVKFTLNDHQQTMDILDAQLNVKLNVPGALFDEPVKVTVRVYEQSMRKTEIGSKILFVSGEKRAWIPLDDTRFLKKELGLSIEAMVDGVNVAVDPYDSSEPKEDAPFLKVSFAQRRPRTIRSTTDDRCKDNDYKGCCLRKLKVSTRFLDKHVWPRDAQVDMCSGDCQLNNHHAPKGDYHNLLKEAKYTHSNRSLPLCCHPTEYDPFRLLITSDDGQVTESWISNLVVKKCGCV